MANPDWLAASIALIAFVESFAIVGIIVPGVALLYVVAFLAGSGMLSLTSTLGLALIGAVIGDGLSFLLGRYFRDDVRDWPVIRNNVEWLDSGERFIARHGVISIVVGRFIGPVRPVMPLVAGTLAMPAPLFFSVNALSALAWAPVYVLPGFALGAALEMPFSSRELTAIAAAVLLIGGGFFYAIRRWFYRDHNQSKPR